jgi:hypothetical protein
VATNLILTPLTKDVRSPKQFRYDLIMNALGKFEGVTENPEKKFVYMHIAAPHGPFVLSSTGEFSPTSDESIGYINSVQYLNKQAMLLIDDILKNSKTPPVIILQGDHGWGLTKQTRNLILNAYYLPGVGKTQVYDTITPVNSFRMIFNSYFGGQFNNLEDLSYFSPNTDTETTYYHFEKVDPTCSK